MKSAIVTAFGGPEVIEIQDVPVPAPKDNEVLIRVKAAGVNYADIMQRHGYYPGGPQPPFGAGFEIAGVVEQAGAGPWKAGDEVMAFCEAGYSEFAAVPAAQVMPKPAGLGFHQATAMACQGLTAYHALLTLGQLRKGQTVLLQAAAGGLGTLMVQMARIAGATVIGTCGSDEKCALAKRLGCAHAVNYREADFQEVVQEVTSGAGCDLVIESVGGEVFEKSLRCVKPRGMMITLGMASLTPPTLNPMDLLVGNICLAGFHLFAYTSDAAAMTKALRDFQQWTSDSALEIIAEHSFPLDQAAAAQELVAQRKSTGKVAILP